MEPVLFPDDRQFWYETQRILDPERNVFGEPSPDPPRGVLADAVAREEHP
jgi:hypothetical protein